MRPAGVWIAMLLLPVLAPPADAAHGPVDTVFVLNSLSFPALALDPVSGDRHVAYLSNGILHHAWETAGIWQTEAVVDSASLTTSTGFHMRVAPDGHPVVAYVRKGAFVCAVRGGGGWQRDTLDMLPGPTFYPIALDLDPTTGEPAVAWAKKSASPGVPSTVWYARHSGGVWATQQVDTTSSAWLNVALGIDGAGRPHLAWVRPRVDGLTDRYVLVCGSGAGPDGPFAAATVDPQLSSIVSMAVDRSNGEPRLAYLARVSSTAEMPRYAYRAPGGTWQSVDVAPGSNSCGAQPAPALALDPAGNPFISLSLVVPIEPGLDGATGPAEVQACGGVCSQDVRVFYRAGGAGPGPFSVEYVNIFPPNDARSGLQAVASGAIGETVLAWRVNIQCPPYGVATTTVTGPSLAGLDGRGARDLALSVSPNPARAGDLLRVEFALARESRVALELHDLVGRRRAMRPPSLMRAGSHTVPWTVPGLSSGLYWLTARGDGQRIGSRAVVILR